MTNYYIFFTLKLLFKSDLYINFKEKLRIKDGIFCFNFVDNLWKDLTRQQIGGKLQSFHVITLKKIKAN